MLLRVGGGRQFRVTFSHGFAFQVDPVGGVHEPVEDGIGQGVIADDLMPVIDRHLRGHDRGADAVTIVDDVVIAAHTINFPVNVTYASLTLNNVASRMTISGGGTRTITVNSSNG